jgi:hypothetical protein
MRINPYQTILVIVTGFLSIGFLFPALQKYFFIAALVVGILGLLSHVTRSWIIWIWEKLSNALGWFNSKVLLSIVFIFFLTPIAVLYRLFKGDALKVNKPPEKGTFIERNHLFNSKDLENPW